jgi:hypothetical protein
VIPAIKYFGYVVRHKVHVFRAGRTTGAPLWRLLVHDLSKFLPSEFFPYASFFYGTGGHDEFHATFVKHWHRNPHHWEHWLRLRNTDEGYRPRALRMPPGLVKEMVADWVGAGKAKADGLPLREWYDSAHPVLHRDSRREAEALMELFE